MANLKIGSVIITSSTAYIVKNILGAGTFGKVALCRKTCNKQEVALKMIKHKEDIEVGKQEKQMLRLLKQRGSEDYNIVRWFNSFEYKGHYCLEFENLDISLADFIERARCLSLRLIRPILYQLATAMDFLKNAGVIHGDLKPENIMMVDHTLGVQVKVIDFGLAKPLPLATRGDIIQTLWYRAPEIFVGANYDEWVDVWSLGCIAVEMLLGKPLFQGYSAPDTLRHIVKTIGPLPDPMLFNGRYTKWFYRLRNIRGLPVWKLKTLQFYQCNERSINRLDDLFQLNCSRHLTGTQKVDWEYFVGLVTKMLEVDPQKRIPPKDMLNHPFLTMPHMVGVCEYVSQSVEMMTSVTGRPTEEECVGDEQPSTSSCTSGTVQKRRKEDEKEEGTSQERSTNAGQKASGPKRQRVTQFTKANTTSQDSPASGSRKRNRKNEDEEDAKVPDRNTLTTKRQKVSPFTKASSISTNQKSPASGSKKRSREDEEENLQLRSRLIIKRQKVVPLIVENDQASTSNNSRKTPASGSKKRSREDTENGPSTPARNEETNKKRHRNG